MGGLVGRMPGSAESRPLAALSVAELRDYRRDLRSEEDRVSYWRRIAHGRIDVLLAGKPSGQSISQAQLVAALADTGTGRRRSGLHRIAAEETLPDLPNLTEDIWEMTVDGSDRAALERAIAALELAEKQLTEYRTALLRRIDEATDALVERYREEPRRALELLAGATGR